MKKFIDAITVSKELINDIIFMCKTRTKQTYFTRKSKINFKEMVVFMLNFVKKSLQIELDEYFEKVMNSKTTITKQGYCQARKKISHEAFIMMADEIIKWYYDDDDDYKKYKGYRLSAIDGSKIGLNNSERLREAFGYQKTKNRNIAMALVNGLYDIENDMYLTTSILPYSTNERDAAIELIEKLKKLGLKNDLILFDRGYPSRELISVLEENGIKYLMRVSRQSLKAINEAKKEDQFIQIAAKGKKITARVIRFMLETREEEILVTNLMGKEHQLQDFKELYNKRWSIETKYDQIKNKLEIENFTGDTEQTIKQDFYASIYLINMAAIAKAEATEKIQKENKGKNLKHEYKANMNILIGKLKDNLVIMLLEDNPKKRNKIFKKIMEEISKNTIPIRPNRKNERRIGKKSFKYSLNKKRCL